STSRRRWSRSPPNWVVSIPEQNADPAPVRTTQPTRGSVPTSSKARPSSSRSSIESAFRFSGRRRVRSATSPLRSTESTPLTTATGEESATGPGERGRAPAEAISQARVWAPTRGNRRLEELLERASADEELRAWWHMAQVNSERLGMSDHSWVHVQVVLNIALRLLRL